MAPLIDERVRRDDKPCKRSSAMRIVAMTDNPLVHPPAPLSVDEASRASRTIHAGHRLPRVIMHAPISIIVEAESEGKALEAAKAAEPLLWELGEVSYEVAPFGQRIDPSRR